MSEAVANIAAVAEGEVVTLVSRARPNRSRPAESRLPAEFLSVRTFGRRLPADKKSRKIMGHWLLPQINTSMAKVYVHECR